MTRSNHDSAAEESLLGLESALAEVLRRVRPPHEVFDRLRGRIQLPNRQEIAARLRDWRRLLVVFGGVMSGLLLIITVARALFHIVSRRQSL